MDVSKSHSSGKNSALVSTVCILHSGLILVESLVDKAVQLDHIGGLFGTNIPSPFLCLLLKMLQLAPTKDIVCEFISNDEYK